MPNQSRTAVKSLLKNKLVFVDGVQTSQFDLGLAKGQKVEIKKGLAIEQRALPGVKIIFEDAYLLVIEKEEGVLSIATDKQKDKTAYHTLGNYLKSKDPGAKIFVVHRLDKDTSGIMMYAKSQKIQKLLQTNWNENIIDRSYLAVVEGSPKSDSGTIESFLAENKALVMYSTQNEAKGQKAITHYQLLKKNKGLSLLKIDLETGRKNQIRVHMQDLGHSVIGDQKYGAKTNPIKRLGLHAWVLAFKHPITGKTLRFETEVPKGFVGLF